MNTYVSKTVAMHRRAEDIFRHLSNFQNFTPVVQDKVDSWEASEDTCSFKMKGIAVDFKMLEREEFKTIKIGGGDMVPLEFYLWIQLNEVAPYDTRMRITIKAELNMMMKMMLGKKLEEGVDTLASSIAAAFNSM